MNVFPRAQMKKIDEWKSGDLVLLCEQNHPTSLALFSKHKKTEDGKEGKEGRQEKEFLIYVNGDEVGLCREITDPNLTALVYEGDIFWTTGLPLQNQERKYELMKEAGSLVRGNKGYFMTIHYGNGVAHEKNGKRGGDNFSQFCLTTAKVKQLFYDKEEVYGDNTNFVIFGSWSLCVLDKKNPYGKTIELASHKLQEKDTPE